MTDQPFDENLLDDFEELVERSVRWIVRHENERGFRDRLAKELHGRTGDPRFARAIAFSLGRTIWNATPLPSNGFRPRSLGWPGANEVCPCGSNRKYKHCCGALPRFPDLAPELPWLLTLKSLPGAKLGAALASGRVPPAVLGEAGRRLLAERGPAAAVRLLEPIFAGAPEALDERLGDALLVLCDAYTEQGRPAKKRELLESIARSEAPKVLRADAAQRLATVANDRGAKEEASEWFALAQRLNPDDIALAPLEVSLLLAQRRAAEAGERAKFWLKRAARRDDVPGRLLRMLESLARDPVAFLADTELDRRGIRADALTGWLAQVRERPLPAYRVATDEPLDPADEPATLARLVRMLTAQGPPASEAARQARRLLSDLKKRAASDVQPELPLDEPPGGETRDARPGAGSPRRSLRRSRQNGTGCFPTRSRSRRSSSISVRCRRGARRSNAGSVFCARIRRRPTASTSWTISPSAIESGAQAATDWMDQRVLEPILARGAAIVIAAAASDRQTPALAWTDPRNRAGLRLVVRWIYLLVRQNRRAEARVWIERMLAWDAQDRHGLRGVLALELGRAGEHEAVLALASRYPGDFLLELNYGRALALFCLGRRDEAAAALAEAIERNRHVPAMLARRPAAPPSQSGFGVEAGSRAEAWYYCEAAHEIWRAAPEAIAWLGASRRKAARRG